MGCNPFASPDPVVTSNVPKYIEEAGGKAFDLAENIEERPFVPYGGERVAGITPAQQQAIDKSIGSQKGFDKRFFKPGEALAAQGGQATAGQYDPTAVGFERVGAERVGTTKFPGADIQSYINPFISGALDPAAAELQRSADIRRKDIGQRASGKGAYGGGRHGIVEAESERNLIRSMEDLYGEGYATAFDKATQLFGADEDRALRAGMSNQEQMLRGNLANQAAGVDVSKFSEQQKFDAFKQNEASKQSDADRKLRAAGVFSDLGTAKSDVTSAQIKNALATGGTEQLTGQRQADIDFEEFMREQGTGTADEQTLDRLLRVLQGTSNITQTSSPGSNPMTDMISTGISVLPFF